MISINNLNFIGLVILMSLLIAESNVGAQILNRETVFGSGSTNAQFGFSLKCSIEFGCGNGDIGGISTKTNPVVRFSAAGGLGSNFISPSWYPSLNMEFIFYNGGLGSRAPGPDSKKDYTRNRKWVLDFITAFTMT